MDLLPGSSGPSRVETRREPRLLQSTVSTLCPVTVSGSLAAAIRRRRAGAARRPARHDRLRLTASAEVAPAAESHDVGQASRPGPWWPRPPPAAWPARLAGGRAAAKRRPGPRFAGEERAALLGCTLLKFWFPGLSEGRNFRNDSCDFGEGSGTRLR